jgi:cell division protein FtsL
MSELAMRVRYGLHQPVANSYLVRERDRRRLRELLMVLLALVPLGVALLAYTWIHLEVLRIGYNIGDLERRLHRLRQDERHLRLEASYLARPERIEQRAREELGMVSPSLEQMVFAEELP